MKEGSCQDERREKLPRNKFWSVIVKDSVEDVQKSSAGAPSHPNTRNDWVKMQCQGQSVTRRASPLTPGESAWFVADFQLPKAPIRFWADADGVSLVIFGCKIAKCWFYQFCWLLRGIPFVSSINKSILLMEWTVAGGKHESRYWNCTKKYSINLYETEFTKF